MQDHLIAPTAAGEARFRSIKQGIRPEGIMYKCVRGGGGGRTQGFK